MSLTRGQVIDTAVSILTRFGLADLSMRRLARELDVQPGALYWHVENKQALLVEVAARLLDTVPAGVGRDGDDPAADLKRLVVAVRRALVPIPDAADVVAMAWAVEPESVPALVAMRGLVDALVGPGAQAQAVTDLLLHRILGSVAAHQNRVRAAAADTTLPSPDDAQAAALFEHGVNVVLRGVPGAAAAD